MQIKLSPDQEKAYDTLAQHFETPGVYTMTGPAGCGKTTLVRYLIADLKLSGRHVVLGAPTGKAALRLKQVTEHPAFTMHKLLYGSVKDGEDDKPDFGDPHAPCDPGDFIVIDEASMVGSELYKDFQAWVPKESTVLYVGDKEQLEPVNDTWGPDLTNPTAALTEVHRQALESPILAYATAVRQGRGDEWISKYEHTDDRLQLYGGIDSAKDWLLHQRAQKADATLITYTHETRRYLNDQVRKELGLADSILSVGDRLVVKANHKHTGLRNGELVTISDVYLGDDFAEVWLEEWPHEPLYIMLDHIEKDAGIHFRWKKSQWQAHRAGGGSWSFARRVLHVHYGQCLTVHSSQGSQWERVGFVWDSAYNDLRRRKRSEARRMLYTAATRASQELMLAVEEE